MSYALISKWIFIIVIIVIIVIIINNPIQLLLLFIIIGTLREQPNQTYHELLNNVRDILREKYSQRPQFSCSHPLDVNLEFIC